MKHIAKIATIIPALAISCLALSSSASALDYTIQIKNSLTGDDIANHQFEFELRNAVTNELIQTKTSNEETITFDPIVGNFSRASIDFYKVIEKDLGEDGMIYDEQVAYVGLHTNGKVAYQKDNTYKYVSKDGKPHPYHATNEELQGQAYAMYDGDTETMTFFRDEAGKYTDKQIDGHKIYFTDFESPARNITDTWFWYDDYTGGSSTSYATEVIFKDAIRPEGSLDQWFSYNRKTIKADFSKLDTSRVTSMRGFFAYGDSLEDADITKFDLSRITNIGMSFNNTKLQEFDSRNYDMSKIQYMDSFFFSSSDLRYINMENYFGRASSADFTASYCVELVSVYQINNFRSGYSFGNPDVWLKEETNETTSTRDFFRGSFSEPTIQNAGTYVRPICNVEPVTFENIYKKPEAPKTVNNVKNPNTAVSAPVVYFILFGALSAGAMLIGYRISKLTR